MKETINIPSSSQ